MLAFTAAWLDGFTDDERQRGCGLQTSPFEQLSP
jgi:hypothetical protein